MKIAYALAGVGRGHVMRASSIGALMLEEGYNVQFFSCCDAEKPLKEKFGKHRVHHLPTPQFSYDSKGNFNVWKTSLNFTKFMVTERKTIIKLSKMLKSEGFDVVVSDFEPLMARAANHANIPLMSLNSQGFVNVCSIPLKYKTLSMQMSLVNALILADPQFSVVAKPVNLPTKENMGCLVGPIIRPHIIGRKWKGKGDHILVYIRESISKALPSVVKWGQDNGLKIYVYGDVEESYENEFDSPMVFKRSFSESQFIEDMITSQVVVSTAGTQLIGEVAYLGAPAILIPEKGQKEQELNAYLASDAYPNIARLRIGNISATRFREAFSSLSGFGERHTEDGSNQAYGEFKKWISNLSFNQ